MWVSPSISTLFILTTSKIHQFGCTIGDSTVLFDLEETFKLSHTFIMKNNAGISKICICPDTLTKKNPGVLMAGVNVHGPFKCW